MPAPRRRSEAGAGREPGAALAPSEGLGSVGWGREGPSRGSGVGSGGGRGREDRGRGRNGRGAEQPQRSGSSGAKARCPGRGGRDCGEEAGQCLQEKSGLECRAAERQGSETGENWAGGLEPLEGGGGLEADGTVGGTRKLLGAFGRDVGELGSEPGDLGGLGPPGSWGAALPGMRPHPCAARPWASALVGGDPGVLAWRVDGLPAGLAEPWKGLWSLGSQPLHRTPFSPATRSGRSRRNLRRRVKAGALQPLRSVPAPGCGQAVPGPAAVGGAASSREAGRELPAWLSSQDRDCLRGCPSEGGLSPDSVPLFLLLPRGTLMAGHGI